MRKKYCAKHVEYWWLTSCGLLWLCNFQPLFAQVNPNGALPLPVLRNIQVDATMNYNPVEGTYQYQYEITNPASNTGKINSIWVDIRSTTLPPVGDPDALTIDFGSRTKTFREKLAFFKNPQIMVPVGIAVPTGWHGSIYARGVAGFDTGVPPGISRNGDIVPPGESRSGFELTSFTPPALREMTLSPDWIYISTNPEGISEEESARAAELEDSLPDHVLTLGPGSAAAGTYQHWYDFFKDFQKILDLGWISDAALAQSLTTQMAAVREAFFDRRDSTVAKQRLQAVLSTLSSSSAIQRRAEVRDFLDISARSLIANTEDTLVPYEPRFSFTPASGSLPLGATFSLTISAVNLADGQVLPNFPVDVEIIKGPHAPRSVSLSTDTAGKAVFSYQGTKIGEDRISIKISDEDPVDLGFADVTWTAGPDLAVPFFAPPILRTQSGNEIVIHDITANIGGLTAPPSITRYYLDDSPTVDITSALVLGERNVPELAPDGLDESPGIRLQLPPGLPNAQYYLAACADAGNSITEVDETNNCSFNTVDGFLSIVAPVEPDDAPVPVNQPPVCTAAQASPAILWPPDHKLRSVSISGVTDADNDPISIKVTAITQDEPVRCLGRSDKAPDGFGIGEAIARVRTERASNENGRVYQISFSAEDGKGGTCQGSVKVGIPRDRRHGTPPAKDDGQRYDSTKKH